MAESQNKSFILHKDTKRLNITDNDLNTQRISAIFQVKPDGLYLEDDMSRETYFPNLEMFPVNSMRDKGSFAVCGTPLMATEFPNFGASRFPSTVWSAESGQAGPSSSFRPQTAFQHPVNTRRTKRLRKQILVADLNDGELNVYTSVHVNILENMGVKDINQSIQEILNTDETFTICDSKGIEITDSQETRALEFWKTPNRKIRAVKTSELPRLVHKTKRKRSNKLTTATSNTWCHFYTVKVRDENLETKNRLKIKDLLETLEVNTNIEVQSMRDNLKDTIGDQTEEIMDSITQMKTSLANASRKLENLDERVSDVKNETYVTSALREILKCKVCTEVPENTIIVVACCGQVLGCGACVQKCIAENDFCILCKNESVVDKIVELKGFQMVLDKFQSDLESNKNSSDSNENRPVTVSDFDLQ
ncbi:unnamed protein product [Mytilus coruscus]|uniref:RING-type domain-containing protein n=1 Tax=Mytilus coruscus TaxID=42192 RepID=A0A6J8BPL9_MYTCO|nr:unnamed protein product [Mytilus coruscus]